MRLIFMLVLLAGIALAGFGVYMLSEKFTADQAELQRLRQIVSNQTELGPVIIANEELRYGKALVPDHVRVVEWPLETRPANVFTSMEELFGPEGSPPRAILRTMEPGEAVMISKVTEPGQDAGVSSRLSQGNRAFTITVDVATGVSGFLNPGDRVDIFWSGTVNNLQTTRLLFQNIPLIAIDQLADSDSKRPIVARTVTVEVSPTTAASLALAQNSGRLTLSLRGADDEVTIDGGVSINQEELVDGKSDSCFVYERVDGKRVEVEVPCLDN